MSKSPDRFMEEGRSRPSKSASSGGPTFSNTEICLVCGLVLSYAAGGTYIKYKTEVMKAEAYNQGRADGRQDCTHTNNTVASNVTIAGAEITSKASWQNPALKSNLTVDSAFSMNKEDLQGYAHSAYLGYGQKNWIESPHREDSDTIPEKFRRKDGTDPENTKDVK